MFSLMSKPPQKLPVRHQDAKPRAGARNPNWKGGVSRRYIREHLPQRLIARYDAIINDPELSSVRDLLAITQVRLTELFEKIPTKESRAAWEALDTLKQDLTTVVAGLTKQPKLQAKLGAIVEALGQAVNLAAHEYHIWDEIHGAIEKARRLAKTEAEREATLQANLTASQTIALFNRLFEIITQEIPDVQTRRRVGQSLVELLQRDSPQFLLTAGNGKE